MMRQFELVERVKAYDPTADEDLLNRAYVFAMKAHGAQKRDSGDPYFTHPLEVAGILTRWHLDSATIATALLHDTIEDTPATLQEIKDLFGDEIAFLVDGVTKLSKIELQSDKSQQAENFRKLVLAMSKDLRVLLVKLADRIHNMRTLHYKNSKEKRRRISKETMEIYAPLAERIGMHEMRNELENLSFSYLNPESYGFIVSRLEVMRKKGEDVVGRVMEQLKEVLVREGVHAVISGREKTSHSIWKKLQKKDVEFEQLSDVMAFRIVVDSLTDCYQALGIIHSTYSMIPGRFKDYISTPKQNGYQSLHTTVIGPESQRIEIQIRTKDMHDVAEMGVAAHWRYKEGDSAQDKKGNLKADGVQYQWVREILDILESAPSPEDFLEHTKMEMFPDQVFCFTPEGDIINLPKGATPVDFAYAVHSVIGDHCVGAKVNGRLVPLRSSLSHGDQVEIITAKNHIPSPDWERFVVTGKARSHIRRAHKQDFQEEEGEEEEREERRRGLSSARGKPRRLGQEEGACVGAAPSEEVSYLPKNLKNSSKGKILQKRPLLVSSKAYALDEDASLLKEKRPASKRIEKKEYSLPIRGLIPGMVVCYPGCCHPLFGDAIVGIIRTGKGVTIHRKECNVLKRYKDAAGYRMDVEWNKDASPQDFPHIGRIKVNILNVSGSLEALSTSLGFMDACITGLKVLKRSSQIHEMLVDVEVRDMEHFKTLIAYLKTIKAVHSIERV